MASLNSGFRLKYNDFIVPFLKEKFSKKSDLSVPRLVKIVLSATDSGVVYDSKVLDELWRDLFYISAQKPVVTFAKKSVSSFKVREGMKLGVKVTLRKGAMYHFLERFVIFVLPNIKGFKGISSSCFDGSGNLTFGVRDARAFLELNRGVSSRLSGLNVTFVTSVNSDIEAKALLSSFDLPFINE